MHDWQSLSHVRWDCKYHVVIVPKYRRRKLYGKFRGEVGRILRDLCRQKGVGTTKLSMVLIPRPDLHRSTDFGRMVVLILARNLHRSTGSRTPTASASTL